MVAIRPTPIPTPPSEKSPFVEGVTYEGTVGVNNVATKVKVTRKGSQHKIELPLLFAGATLWEDKANLPDRSLAKAGATSIDENPALKRKILDTCDAIEDAWTTPEIELKIVPTFLKDESALLQNDSDTVGQRTADLWDGICASREKSGPLPVLVSPAQSNVITPCFWDITAPPDLLAHEVGHVLGNFAEGYTLRRYPLDGIMGDENAFIALSKLGKRPHPTSTDVSSVLGGLINSKLTPALPMSKEEARALLPPSNDDLIREQQYTPQFDEWHSLNQAQRDAGIQIKLEDYKKEHP